MNTIKYYDVTYLPDVVISTSSKNSHVLFSSYTNRVLSGFSYSHFNLGKLFELSEYFLIK